MRKISAVIICFVFFIWILPLGVFIKPSQEELACNGQRAICLCTHLLAKAQAKGLTQSALKSSGTHKEESSSNTTSHHFLTNSVQHHSIWQNTTALDETIHLYTCQFYQSIEHVPKA